MKWLSKPLAELIGLFVDDGSLVVAVLCWIAIIWLTDLYAPVAVPYRAVLLFFGIAAVFLENVTRGARKIARSR